MKVKHIIFLASIILFPILILAFIPYKSLVRIELKTSELSFETLTPLQNFFSLEHNYGKINKISIKSYDSLFNYISGVKNNQASFISSDITDKIVLYDASMSELNLNKNSKVNIHTNKGVSKKYSLQISNNNNPIEFVGNSDELKIKINSNTDTTEKMLSVTPLENSIKLHIHLNENHILEEEEIIRAKNIVFQKNINNELYSSIKSGEISLLDINKEFTLTQNSSINLPEGVEFQIMNLKMKDGLISITLEGYTNKLLYGLNKTNIAPSLLFYLTNNNFLLTIANTFLILITFSISLIQFSNEKK